MTFMRPGSKPDSDHAHAPAASAAKPAAPAAPAAAPAPAPAAEPAPTAEPVAATSEEEDWENDPEVQAQVRARQVPSQLWAGTRRPLL